MEHCLICERIQMIKEGKNPYFVAELETGYVVVGDHQYFSGYTLFLSKDHKHELHDLDMQEKQQFLFEMSVVAEAVHKAFKPDKLNYELLGNGDAHLHWHIFPRRLTEPSPRSPVWWTDRAVMYADSVRPSAEELRSYKQALYDELKGDCNNIQRIGDFQ